MDGNYVSVKHAYKEGTFDELKAFIKVQLEEYTQIIKVVRKRKKIANAQLKYDSKLLKDGSADANLERCIDAERSFIENKELLNYYKNKRDFLRVGGTVKRISKYFFELKHGVGVYKGKRLGNSGIKKETSKEILDELVFNMRVAKKKYNKGLISAQEYSAAINAYRKQKNFEDVTIKHLKNIENKEIKLDKLNSYIPSSVGAYGFKRYFVDGYSVYRKYFKNLRKVANKVVISAALDDNFVDYKYAKDRIKSQRLRGFISKEDAKEGRKELNNNSEMKQSLRDYKKAIACRNFIYVGATVLITPKIVIELVKKTAKGIKNGAQKIRNSR